LQTEGKESKRKRYKVKRRTNDEDDGVIVITSDVDVIERRRDHSGKGVECLSIYVAGSSVTFSRPRPKRGSSVESKKKYKDFFWDQVARPVKATTKTRKRNKRKKGRDTFKYIKKYSVKERKIRPTNTQVP
jgi:hypothetical protein